MSAVIWSALTIAIFFGMRWVFQRTKQPLLHPVLWATILVIVLIETSGHDYASYKAETSWLVWLLGPAVVALAVPVYHMRAIIRENLRLLSIVIPSAVIFSMLSVWGMLAAFPIDTQVVKSLSLKAITAPVAFELSRENGGIPTLTAIGVMFASILGAVLGPGVLRLARVTDPKAIGLALGCGSHGVGTARALELGRVHGAFASLGMSCSAMLASVVGPLVLRYLIL